MSVRAFQAYPKCRVPTCVQYNDDHVPSLISRARMDFMRAVHCQRPAGAVMFPHLFVGLRRISQQHRQAQESRQNFQSACGADMILWRPDNRVHLYRSHLWQCAGFAYPRRSGCLQDTPQDVFRTAGMPPPGGVSGWNAAAGCILHR